MTVKPFAADKRSLTGIKRFGLSVILTRVQLELIGCIHKVSHQCDYGFQ
jgi:hypothetical protein